MKKTQTRWSRIGAVSIAATGAASALFLAIAGCYSDPYYYDPYAYYGYYYPTGYAYSDTYYVDYGYTYGYPLSRLKGTSSAELPGTLLRDLALGANDCPDHATVTMTTTTPACDSGAGALQPLSTTITFDGCELLDGSRLDGTMQIVATQSASDEACDDSTTIDVSYTSTTTQLVYTKPDGARVVMPLMTRTGSYTRPLHAPPAAITINVDGSVERYGADGSAISNDRVLGTQTLTLLGAETGFVSDGTLTLADSVKDRGASVTATALTRMEGCCYPLSGKLDVVRSGGDDSHWTFGPSCGDASVDGHDVTLDACL
jgi:hypothetical protein